MRKARLRAFRLLNDPLADIRALTSSLLLVSCLSPARPPRWRPAAWSRLVMGRSRRGGPSAVTPVTASHVAVGRVTAVTASARRPGPLPLAISLASRSEGDRSVGHGSPRPLVAAPLRPLCCRRDLAATLRTCRRSKSPHARRATPFLLLGSSCHAATGARLVPWRQPGGWGMKSLIASTAPFRPEPDLLASAAAPSGGGAGLGRDRYPGGRCGAVEGAWPSAGRRPAMLGGWMVAPGTLSRAGLGRGSLGSA